MLTTMSQHVQAVMEIAPEHVMTHAKDTVRAVEIVVVINKEAIPNLNNLGLPINY